MNRDEMYLSLGVSDKVLQFGEAVLDELKPRFAGIEEIAELNQAKVIGAMQKNRVNATHFAASTGYGYDDEGRDNLERVYASAFHTEAALVRPQITCGTHALAIALSANLLPGDEMLAISGKPYDTLEEVIGLRESPCSLKEYGVSYAQVDLREDGSFDFPAIERALNDKTKLIHIQRSKGYCPRPTISVDAIGEAIAFCKKLRPDVVVMVDNCYGEFVEANEPSDFGADMIVGSLIKNPGGGLAPIGGYICGTQKCIDRCAYRLSAPGLGQEVGANLGLMPALYQGFFLAPSVVSGAVKGAVFVAACYEKLGFTVVPSSKEARHDIIQCVELGSSRGHGRLLQGHPVRRRGRQLCRPCPRADARLRLRRHHGGGRVRAGQLHRALGRRPRARALRRLLSRRSHLVSRQAWRAAVAAKDARRRTHHPAVTKISPSVKDTAFLCSSVEHPQPTGIFAAVRPRVPLFLLSKK